MLVLANPVIFLLASRSVVFKLNIFSPKEIKGGQKGCEESVHSSTISRSEINSCFTIISIDLHFFLLTSRCKCVHVCLGHEKERL